MASQAIEHWITKAKHAPTSPKDSAREKVQVITRIDVSNRSRIIMQVAERLLPWLRPMLDNIRDENHMLVQPARVRAIALNMAQGIVREQEEKLKG